MKLENISEETSVFVQLGKKNQTFKLQTFRMTFAISKVLVIGFLALSLFYRTF